jgi:hypothetical protein
LTFTDVPMPQTPTVFRIDLDNGKERFKSGYDWKLDSTVNGGPEYELFVFLIFWRDGLS